MNALEFINDEFVSWDVTYSLNGALLNRIPVVKKLKIRELVTFRGLSGNLTRKNNPFLTSGNAGLYRFPEGTYLMDGRPYMEIAAGIENIFSFLRLDYVWRLSYRDHPGIQRSGLRFMMRLSF
jgi:hypothetical protein